jgi:hypothetical protein
VRRLLGIIGCVVLLTVLLAGCEGVDSTGSSSSTTATTAAPVSNPLPCRKYSASTNVGTVRDSALSELSGLAMSPRHPGIMWTHNDSGDSARMFAISTSGQLQATIGLDEAGAFDIEDIAISNGNVWLADTGDNLHFRSSVQLYRVTEPEIADASVTVDRVDVKFRRPSGEGTYSVDSEALFFDRAGNAYLVEKTDNKQSAWVFQIAADALNGGSATAEPVVQVTGNSNGSGVGPTGADMSADGTTLVIKNYSETFMWRFTADSSVPLVLTNKPSAPCVIKAGLGEAITFAGFDLLTVEEGVGKPIRRTRATN